VKKPAGINELDIGTRARNALIRSVRCLDERGFALLTQRWKRSSMSPPAQAGSAYRLRGIPFVLVLFEHKLIT
jgi:hypothetical protein